MAKGKKPMSAKEKKLRAEARAELREAGVLPPKKKPLNRKRFILEAKEAFESMQWDFSTLRHLAEAIGCTMDERRASAEDVGVAKMVKVTCEIARFYRELDAAGRESFKVSELYERIKPILDA